MSLPLAAAAARLESDGAVFAALVEGVSDEQARWKPEPSQWSIVEVINHLADEEVEDFRTRLDLTLHRPGAAWPPIDPQGWPRSRAYLERELGASLERFLSERRRSVAWLSSLADPDWSAEYGHPSIGTLHAGDLLTAWLAHDLIHVRQITRLHYQWLERRAAPFLTGYAGTF